MSMRKRIWNAAMAPKQLYEYSNIARFKQFSCKPSPGGMLGHV